jgi:hypothetical protein
VANGRLEADADPLAWTDENKRSEAQVRLTETTI